MVLLVVPSVVVSGVVVVLTVETIVVVPIGQQGPSGFEEQPLHSQGVETRCSKKKIVQLIDHPIRPTSWQYY